MRKIQKKIPRSKILVILLLFIFLFSLIKISMSYAATDSLLITNIEVSNKSDTANLDDLSFENCKIKSNVTFHKLGDYITYKIKIKNDDTNNYTIKSISNDNTNQYISYIHESYEGTKFNSKDEIEIEITEKYVKENTDISTRIQNISVNFKFVLEDENGNIVEKSISINKNPYTGDNIQIYIVIFIISFILLVWLLKNQRSIYGIKHNKNRFKFFSLLLIGMMIMPGISRAGMDNSLTCENTVVLKNKLLVTYIVNNTSNLKTINYNENLNDLEDPDLEGYEFVEWDNEDGTVFNKNTNLKDDIKIIAELNSAIPCEIKFDKNDETATGTMPNQQVQSGTTTKLNENSYEKIGYELKEWNTRADGMGDSYTDMGDINISQNITLYAQWKTVNTQFIAGEDFNSKIKTLAGTTSPTWTTSNTNITKIKRYDGTPDLTTMTSDNIVSTEESEYPIYMWYDDGMIYWWSQSKKPKLNSNCSKMFGFLTKLEEIDVTSFTATELIDTSRMFYDCCELKELDVSKFNTENVTDMSYMFGFCSKITELDVSNFKTQNVINMSGLFASCNLLNEIDVSDFNTSNVTNMAGMFNSCRSINTIDVSNFNTEKVTDMSAMFYYCTNLSALDLYSFDTKNVINMGSMFGYCKNLSSLNISSFDTENVNDMNHMFSNCDSFIIIDISSFNMKSVFYLKEMFSECDNLKKVILSNSEWNSSVSNHRMFMNSKALEEIYFGGLIRASGCGVFYGCESLKTIYVTSAYKSISFNYDYLGNVMRDTDTFYNCSSLVGGNGTTWASDKTGTSYARVDRGYSYGYFTLVEDTP